MVCSRLALTRAQRKTYRITLFRAFMEAWLERHLNPLSMGPPQVKPRKKKQQRRQRQTSSPHTPDLEWLKRLRSASGPAYRKHLPRQRYDEDT